MRTSHQVVAILSLVGAVAGAHAGCTSTWDEFYAPLTDPALETSSSGTSSSSSGTGGAGGGMPACTGDPTADKSLVADKCGVFVSATAADGGDGTKAKPFKLLSDAVAKGLAEKKWVLVCAESFTEAETLTIDGSLDVYGGFTGCENKEVAWTWNSGKRANYTGPANKIALLLQSGSGTIHVENVDVAAPSATAKGSSSIAVYVDGGTAELSSSDVTAGDGMLGEDGADAPMTAAQAGSNGNNATDHSGDACSADTVPGAPQKQTTCGTAFSIGGKGGDGNELNGGPGANGLPNNNGGQAGSGDDGTAGWTCAGNGGNGKDGLPGGSGKEGAGASMMNFGTLATTGFVGAAGGDGDAGTPGQGGGGGGGVRGSATLCAGKSGKGGASGGSGGSGGCGGLGGGGGKAGGASIAFVSANAKVTLTNVRLAAGNGGNGGRGGNPQQGGAGSSGGSGGLSSVAGLEPGCDGGKGGKGGDGGPGGGGRGGHSIGLAATGSAPQIDPANITIGSAGLRGEGGSNDFKGNHGAPGEAAKCWDVEANMACK